jgi:hypothetical protein
LVVGGAVALHLLAVASYGQADTALSHFVVVAPSGNDMTVLVQGTVVPTVNGSPIANGDEIGVFTPEGLCVGGAVWNGATAVITVWGDNTQTAQVDGMAVGEKLCYRIWQVAESREVVAFATYNTASPFSRSDSTYVVNGVSVLASLSGTPAPGAPSISVPANNAGSEPTALTLAWNTSATAVSYAVQVSTVSSFSTTILNQGGLTASSLAVSGLRTLTGYYWQVNATNAGGTGAWSTVAGFGTGPHFSYTGSTGNNMTVLAQGGLNPTIDGGALPSGDEIGVFTPGGLCVGSAAWNDSTVIITVWGSNAQSSQIDGMMPGDKLCFRLWDRSQGKEYLSVATYNTASPFSRSDSTYVVDGVSVLSTLAGYSPPAPPAPSLPSNGSAAIPVSPTLAWAGGGGGPTVSYSVQISTVSNFATTVFSSSALTSSSLVAGIALNYLTRYYWQVCAAGPGGMSAWSSPGAFTTVIPPPGVPVLSSPANNALSTASSLTLQWGTMGFAASYEVQVATGSAFCTTILDQAGLTSAAWTIAGLVGSGFYWRVNATDVSGTSPWSASWQFTTTTCLTIPLVPGWNMSSLNNQPIDSSATAIFGNPAGFIFVKDIQGDAYIPSIGIEELDTVHTGIGYQVYTQTCDTLVVRGVPVDVATTSIALAEGWNIIAFLPQTSMDAAAAFASVANMIVIAKDNGGDAYLPEIQIDEIGEMLVGQGYMVYATEPFTFTYPAGADKKAAAASAMVKLPPPRHFAIAKNTGNNATLVATRISMPGGLSPDGCEIGAFDERGVLVGAGSVERGRAAFPIWGDDPQTKEKDGCAIGEMVQLRIWDGKQELPLTLQSGNSLRYDVNGIITCALAAPAGGVLAGFNLSEAYPNPFRNNVRIAFDVPAINGNVSNRVEINVYDMKGMLVHRIAAGKFLPGHYALVWDGVGAGGAALGPGFYVLEMKAREFEKRTRIIKVQ